jgi:hypothetical protein
VRLVLLLRTVALRVVRTRFLADLMMGMGFLVVTFKASLPCFIGTVAVLLMVLLVSRVTIPDERRACKATLVISKGK